MSGRWVAITGAAALVVAWAGVAALASAWGTAGRIDTEVGDGRDAVLRASNVFVGRVVGEELQCLSTSAPDSYVVYDIFLMEVERNVKGRVDGVVRVWQEYDDTGRFGPDGRMVSGRTYLVMARTLSDGRGYATVDYRLGYVEIESPEERADLVAEAEGYLAEPTAVFDTPTPVPPDARATWDAQSTQYAATRAIYPTPFPCGPEIVATATAMAPRLGDGQALMGANGPPPNATSFPVDR